MLRPAAIEEMLPGILGTDAVNDLAALVYTRTKGNVLSIRQLMEHLQMESLLEYSLSTFVRWPWDTKKIQDNTAISDNILAILTTRIKMSPQSAQRCLQVAALLGFRFDQCMLTTDLLASETDEESVISALDLAVKEGLLEVATVKAEYRFSHDKPRRHHTKFTTK